MALSVGSNVASLNAQSNLNRTSGNLSKSLEQLSSDLKINRGADGPTPLVISEEKRAQIASLQTAIDTTSKAINLVQTGEGALNTISSLLDKARGLALDSANGSNNVRDREANQAELTHILGNIDQIAKTTQLDNRHLLDGSASVSSYSSDQKVRVVTQEAGTKSGTYEIDIQGAATLVVIGPKQNQAGELGQDETLSINGIDIHLKKGQSQAAVASRINEFTDQTGVVAEVNEYNSAANKVFHQMTLATTNYGSSARIEVVSSVEASSTSSGFGTVKSKAQGSDITGTIGGQKAQGHDDFLTAVTGDAKGLSLQISANASDPGRTADGPLGTVTVENKGLTFQLGEQTAWVGFINAATTALGKSSGKQFDNLSAIDVTTQAKATDAVQVIDRAIGEISTARSQLGAFQANTLGSIETDLNFELEKIITAPSIAIRDADAAAEIAAFAKGQITTLQASVTVLSNANQLPQLALSLLR